MPYLHFLNSKGTFKNILEDNEDLSKFMHITKIWAKISGGCLKKVSLTGVLRSGVLEFHFFFQVMRNGHFLLYCSLNICSL